ARDVRPGVSTRAERALPLRLVLGPLTPRARLPQRTERLLRAHLATDRLRRIGRNAGVLGGSAGARRAVELPLRLRRAGAGRERRGHVVHRDQPLLEPTYRDERPARQHAVGDGPTMARALAPPVWLSRRASPLPDRQRTSRADDARCAAPALR